MKKLVLSVLVFATLFSCQKDDFSNQVTTPNNSLSLVNKRGCGSHEYLLEQLKKDPSLAARMQQIQNFTNQQINLSESRLLANGKIEIPVVFNILYNTASQNIPDSQLDSQIAILNQDFNAANTDFGLVPNIWSSIKANIGITFVKANVIRKFTTKTTWTGNEMKIALSPTTGGINAISPTTKLNFWIVNSLMSSSGGVLLGRSSFPGEPAATDGIVVDYRYVGKNGVGSGPYYNLGRTATHEIGHWMNLEHIWGNATCGNDLVGDTPTAQGPNYDVPAFPTYGACSTTIPMMTMNYMDYTDDKAMYMFTNGQKARMNAVFAVAGPRASFRN
jgi:Pregnancy-associated plasma protein-A